MEQGHFTVIGYNDGEIKNDIYLHTFIQSLSI